MGTGLARGGAAVLAAALLLLLPGLGRLAARETTDARYLEAAREMWVTGDWLVPRLAGLPHLDKPPLSYWSGALGFEVLGPTPFAGRLLQQLALAATALVVYGFGRRRLGPRGAAAAAGVFLTSSLVFGASRALSTDLWQLLFLTAALALFYEAARERAVGPTILAFGCLGLSMWAKGPIALLVALAVVLPFLALARLRLPARGVLLGAALFLALGFPWYALLVARDPSLADYFFERQLLSRATAEGEGHVHGLLYLLLRGVLMGFLPWTPLVGLVLWRLRPPRAGPRDPLELFLWLWTVAPFLFFELFPTKLSTYLLPCFPGAAFLVGRALETARLDDRGARRALAASLGLAAVTAVLLAVLLAYALGAPARVERWLVPDELAAPRAYLAAVALIAAGLGALALRALRGGVPVVAACAALGAAYLVGYNALAAPAPDHAADARLVRSVPGARVVQYGLFRPGLLFYLDDRAEHAVALRREFADRAAEPGGARLALRHEDVLAWMAEDVPTFVLAKTSKVDALARTFHARPVRRTRHFALLANGAALRALEGEGRAPVDAADPPL